MQNGSLQRDQNKYINIHHKYKAVWAAKMYDGWSSFSSTFCTIREKTHFPWDNTPTFTHTWTPRLEPTFLPLSQGCIPRLPSHTVIILIFFVRSLSHVQLFATTWTVACQASLSFTISQSLLKLMSIESMMPSNHLILCPSLLLSPSIFSSSRVFSSEKALCIWWPK